MYSICFTDHGAKRHFAARTYPQTRAWRPTDAITSRVEYTTASIGCSSGELCQKNAKFSNFDRFSSQNQ